MSKAPKRKPSAAPAVEADDEDAPSEISFGPLPSLVGYRIRTAYGVLFQSFSEMLKHLGLAPGQYSVLLLVSLNPGLSQMALADATGIDRSTIVPITNRFVKMGWIRRNRRRDDRRVYSLKITPLGQSVIDKARPIVADHEERLVSKLSQSERLQLTDLLSRITDPRITPAPKPRSAQGRASKA